jgi:transcriptional regulator with XRE-family HTH domain
MAISRNDIVEQKPRITNNNEIDMHVGKRERLRCTLLGMIQE